MSRAAACMELRRFCVDLIELTLMTLRWAEERSP
jgi:hypothetical protein